MAFVARSLQDCLSDAASDGDGARLHHVFSETPATIALPPLAVGSFFLERMAVRELPGGVSWRDVSYEAFASPMFILKNALVHSSAGILAVGETVIEETLIYTSLNRNHFNRNGSRIELKSARSTKLPGRHVHLLSGASRNYFHFMIDSIARLAVLESSGLDARGSLLLPPTRLPIADEVHHLLQWNRGSSGT